VTVGTSTDGLELYAAHFIFYPENTDRMYLRRVGNIANNNNKVYELKHRINMNKISHKKWFPGPRFVSGVSRTDRR
jgi:hypothetical protein